MTLVFARAAHLERRFPYVTNFLHTFPRNASVTIASTLREQSVLKGFDQRDSLYFHFHFTTVAVALAACQESKVDAGTNTRITENLLPCLTLPQVFTPALALHRSFPTRPSPTLLPFASAAGSQSLVIILHQCTSARHANTSKAIFAQYSYLSIPKHSLHIQYEVHRYRGRTCCNLRHCRRSTPQYVMVTQI